MLWHQVEANGSTAVLAANLRKTEFARLEVVEPCLNRLPKASKPQGLESSSTRVGIARSGIESLSFSLTAVFRFAR